MKKNLQIMFTLLIFCSISFLSVKYIFSQPEKNKSDIDTLFDTIFKKDNSTLSKWAEKVLNKELININEINESCNELEKAITDIGKKLLTPTWEARFKQFKIKLITLKSGLTTSSYKTDLKNISCFFPDEFALTYLGLKPVSRQNPLYSGITGMNQFTSNTLIHNNTAAVNFAYAISTDILFPWSFIARQYNNLKLELKGEVDAYKIDSTDQLKLKQKGSLKDLFNDFKTSPNKPDYFDKLPDESKKNLLITIIEASVPGNSGSDKFEISNDLEALIYGVPPSSYKGFVFNKTPQDLINIFKGLFNNKKYFRNLLLPGCYNFDKPNHYELLYGLIMEYIFLKCFNFETSQVYSNQSLLEIFSRLITQLFDNIYTTNAAKECKFELKNLDETNQKFLKKVANTNTNDATDLFQELSKIVGNSAIKFFQDFLKTIDPSTKEQSSLKAQLRLKK